jgi:hypothetical protein
VTSTNVFGTVTCNQSPITAAITNAGSPGAPALGNVSALDFKHNGNEACSDNISVADHTNNTAQALPWAVSIEWLSDDTNGDPNGTLTLSGVSIAVTLNASVGGPATCNFQGDFNNTGGTTNMVQGDLYNPDNGLFARDLEMVWDDEPLELGPGSSVNCPPTADLSARYALTGTGLRAGTLQVRNPPAPPSTGGNTPTTPTNPPSTTTPSSGAVAGQTGASTKRKCKKRKGAAAAKKCKRKK